MADSGENEVRFIQNAAYIPPNCFDRCKMKAGSLTISNFDLTFNDDRDGARENRLISPIDNFFTIPLSTIHNVDFKKIRDSTRVDTTGSGLIIVCKDFRQLKFTMSSPNAQSFYQTLKKYATANLNNMPIYAYLFGLRCKTENVFADGWNVYDIVDEFSRQNITTYKWRISKLNEEFQLCDTYPPLIAVPETVDDDLLKGCAAHRSKGRVPALSWLHPESKASLTRASQPLVGVSGKRCAEDEKTISLIREANANDNSLLIFDARPQVNAVVNKGKGGGSENPNHYENVKYIFLNIKNIHTMRSTQGKLFEACFPEPHQGKWLKAFADSKWLYHIKQIIFAAVSVADKIENHKTSVLVHCSDGWDRTPQITALAMLMLDPYYRTLIGFQVLIEKEWVSFGHKFAQRTGGPADGGFLYMPDGKGPLIQPSPRHQKKMSSSEERSPVFLQFIDCVWQMLCQFPNAFEFNEQLLICILDELYAGRFGNFLFDNIRSAKDNEAHLRTASLWSYVKTQEDRFRNCLYTPAEVSGHRVILPQHSLAQLKFWNAYYTRWHHSHLHECQEPTVQHTYILQEVVKKFRALQAETVQRRQEEQQKQSQNNSLSKPSGENPHTRRFPRGPRLESSETSVV